MKNPKLGRMNKWIELSLRRDSRTPSVRVAPARLRFPWRRRCNRVAGEARFPGPTMQGRDRTVIGMTCHPSPRPARMASASTE